MKRNLIFLSISILALVSCSKQGSEGPQGAQGPAGSANIQVYIDSIQGLNWIVNPATQYSVYSSDMYVTWLNNPNSQTISVAVSPYYYASTTWAPLPAYSILNSEDWLNFKYSVGKILVSYYDTLGGPPPLQTLYFKITVSE